MMSEVFQNNGPSSSAPSATNPLMVAESPGVARAEVFRRRCAEFRSALDTNGKVNMKMIRKLCFNGIPDNVGLRGTLWKLLLGYLPPDRSIWERVLAEKRTKYEELKRFLHANPQDQQQHQDHPLNKDNGSTWNAFFADNELTEAIVRDVQRTLPGLQFFATDSSRANALKDALFIYSKINTATHYVQGMNEVLAPLLYVFVTDSSPTLTINEVEADAFGCFTNLMAEISETFCRKLDNTMLESHSTIGRFHALLASLDPELFKRLNSQSIDPRFYSFRWLSLLFSQEFQLPDVLRLWDTLFSDENRFDFLLFFACAAVMLQRDKILKDSFSDNLQLLQSYPPNVDISMIIKKATELRDNADPDILDPHKLTEAVNVALGKTHEPTADELLRAEQEEMEAILKRSRMPRTSSKPVSIPSKSDATATTSIGSQERTSIPGALPESLFGSTPKTKHTLK